MSPPSLLRAHLWLVGVPLVVSLGGAGCLSWPQRDGAANPDGGLDASLATSPEAGASHDATPDHDATLTGADGAAEDAALADAAFSADDAGGRADAGATPPFCTSQPRELPCADFDTTTLADWTWTEIGQAPGTSLAIAELGKTAGNHVLRAAVAGVPGETAMAAFQVPSDLSAFDLAFDLKTSARPPADGVTLFFKLQADIASDAGTSYPGISFGIGPAGTFIAVDDLASDTWDQHGLPALPATWTRVHIKATFGAAGTLWVQYDDRPPSVFSAVPIVFGTSSKVSIKLGLYTQGSSASEALFDDAIIATTPAL